MNVQNDNFSTNMLNKRKEKTPYLLIDLGEVVRKYERLQTSLPQFEIFYAVKCNPEQPILEALKQCGSSFEIASLGELKRLLKIGVDPKDVIYSNPIKPEAYIKESYKLGVRYFAYDSSEELEKLAHFAPGSKVYLRLTVSNQGSLINLANKFGANKSRALPLFSLAKDLGLEAYGLTFHIGSQSENIQLWDQAFDDMIDVLNKLQEHKFKVQVLNIGGGFPAQYNKNVPSITEIGKRIAKNSKRLPYDMKLWCEPGRYIVGEAGVICTTIIGKTTRHNTPWLYLDVGRFQAFIEMFESSSLQYPIFTSLDKEPESKQRSLYTITGPTCDSYDTISRDISLPTNLKVGDKLYFATAGAYTHVYGAPFNDFPVPYTIFV